MMVSSYLNHRRPGDTPLAYLTLSLGISVISERHVDVSRGAYFSAGLVVPVEGHPGDRGQDDRVCRERGQWRLHLCLITDEGEADRRIRGDRRRQAAVERVRNVHA